MERKELDEARMQGQTEIWWYMFSFVDSMALKSVVELRIADIKHFHGVVITLSQIASCISDDLASRDITTLARIMKFLVHPLYDLTHSSRWLLHDTKQTLAPMHYFSHCIKECGPAFQKAHGREIWDLASENPGFNGLFNDGMECIAKFVTNAILLGYKQWLSSVGLLVNVGGETRGLISEIVKAYPHIKGVNFNLPHAISMTPAFNGVSHIAGDMFCAIPNAETVIMKDCVKILQICKKTIPRENGKVIMVEIILKEDGIGVFDEIGFIFDLLMIAHTNGKERTEVEWKKILEGGSFSHYKIINIPDLLSIIEAYPDG
ncbi:hypothetical protein ERO13_D02G181350v2 [Gossypium hirsutum]|nr:hypothetical protein ERO13_D02G181350v2 [Gossypium hirsutum]